ncbi:MAG: T9SS type A sorting domain-containing protein [candidate division KSB1 bacterium]|nr:T9SS type A sorting domain-containing protein [candidate division KSB1 bacterium]
MRRRDRLYTLSCRAVLVSALIAWLDGDWFSQRGESAHRGQVCQQIDAPYSLASHDSASVSMVYVAFPDQGDTVVPAFWRELEVVFSDYFAKMSGGRHRPQLCTLLRPGQGGGCYFAQGPYAQFEPSKDLPYLCRDVLLAVAQDHPGALERSGAVILAFLQDCLPAISGMAMLPCAAGAPYDGPGIVVDLQPKDMFFGLVAHEYAHLLGFVHPPSVGRKHFGDYCLMDSKVHRLVPLCVENLHRAGWMDQAQVVDVTDTARSVAMGDVRKGGTVLRVFATPNQYFWVCNHQGSDYDSAYAGRGLLVWHIKVDDGLPQSGPEIWDVESAAGMWTAGRPDPVAGLDSLDISPDYTGSSADFFQLRLGSASSAHFGPRTNPSSHAYRLVPGTHDSLIQDQNTGVSLHIVGQKGDTLFVDVEVPNEPPRFGQTHLLPPVVAAQVPMTVECAVEDDHRVEQVVVHSTRDTLLGFATTPLEPLGHGWWRASLRAESVDTTLLYYLVASDASGRTARLPARGWFASAVQGQPKAELMPAQVQVHPSGAKGASERLTLTNHGEGLLLFQTHLIPESTNTTELWSPPAHIVPHGLDPLRWWDAAEVTLVEGDQRLGTVRLKNDQTRLYVRQEWYFLTKGDEYLVGIQLRIDPQAPRVSITASSQSVGVTEGPRWFAEPAITVAHAFGCDAQGEPCLAMEASIALPVLETAEKGWPRLGFFAQRFGGRPQEQRMVAWPPVGSGYDESDLALLRLNASAPGLTVQPSQGAVPQGTRTLLTLSCSAEAEARARLVVTTNDPSRPVLLVPIKVSAGGEARGEAISIHPNPARGGAHIMLTVAQPCKVEVAVYDVLGRRVKVLAQGYLEAGATWLQWDGKDTLGNDLPSGVYLIRARVGNRTHCTKLVRLR